MPKFKLIDRFGPHDFGAVFDDNGERVGNVLYCVSNKYKDTIAVNIEAFRKADRYGIYGVLFRIDVDPIFKTKLRELKDVQEMIEYARQPENSDFVILHWDVIEGRPKEFEF